MNKTLFLLAHIYANRLLREYNGSFQRAFQIGLIKAKHKLKLI